MKDKPHRTRFREAVIAATIIAQPGIPRVVKKWLRRAYHQELDEIAYLLEIGDRPEGIEVRRT